MSESRRSARARAARASAAPDAGRTLRRRRRAVRTVAGVMLIAAAGGVLLRSDPSTAATLGGVATIVDPGTSQALTSGGSTTVFTVALPTGAACSGDTANDGYHVYSYLVPHGTDLGTVKFVNFPTKGYGFVDNTGTYYGAANTAINTGQIIGIPTNLEWAPLTNSVALSTLLGGGSSASWDAGIACADTNGNLSDNWNVELTFTADGSDPNGFTWSTGGGGGGTTTTTAAGGSTTTTAGGGSTTTTAGGGPTTTTDAGTTTTTSGGATTTTAGDTTTTAANTVTTLGVTTSSFSDTTAPFSGGGGSGGDPSGGGGGSLAFTGSSTSHYLAFAMLALGLGLMLVGTELAGRGRRTLGMAWRALR